VKPFKAAVIDLGSNRHTIARLARQLGIEFWWSRDRSHKLATERQEAALRVALAERRRARGKGLPCPATPAMFRTADVAAKLGISPSAVLNRAGRRGIRPEYRATAHGRGRECVFTMEEVARIGEVERTPPLRHPSKPVTPLSFEEFMRKVEAA
jgi:hypothetical protein